MIIIPPTDTEIFKSMVGYPLCKLGDRRIIAAESVIWFPVNRIIRNEIVDNGIIILMKKSNITKIQKRGIIKELIKWT